MFHSIPTLAGVKVTCSSVWSQPNSSNPISNLVNVVDACPISSEVQKLIIVICDRDNVSPSTYDFQCSKVSRYHALGSSDHLAHLLFNHQ